MATSTMFRLNEKMEVVWQKNSLASMWHVRGFADPGFTPRRFLSDHAFRRIYVTRQQEVFR
jgi:hypothetical protein